MLALDGRLARRESTRAAVVDALLALIDEGDLRPTAPRIAERAGVSLRSVFQHFRDLEALFAAAADRQLERLQDLVRPIAEAGPLATRLAAFVHQRTRLLEAIAPVRRAALLLEPFSPAIAERLRGARRLARAGVEQAFAPELARHCPAARRELLAALTAASAWSTWEALRAHQGLSAAAARRVVARTLGALLEETRAPLRRSEGGVR
jgi:AcrR family transcriptional regulator